MDRRRPDGAATAPSHYSGEPSRLSEGNGVELLIDGEEAFPAMLDAIGRAREYVHLETYILADDDVGRRFAAALADRARRGVTVRLLFDAVGSFLLPADFVARLRESGVEVVEFRPLRKIALFRHWSRRDHRKILVVDGKLGFTGGLNVSSDYASVGREAAGWRDTHIRALGPVVSQLEALFRATWHRSGGAPYRPYPARSEAGAEARGTSLAAVIASDGGRKSVIRKHYLHAFLTAKDTIFVANAYFVPDRGLVRALRRAARRGVRVVLLVPAESDVRIVQRASEHLYDRLLRSGVQIYQWPRTHMHAKTAVVDGVWSVVGSYNLDSVSFFQNHEVVIECVDRSFGQSMIEQFEMDCARAIRLQRSEWRQRPWWRRATEALAYQLKRWL